MDQWSPASAPLADAILRAGSRERIAFHMPGHASGRGLPHELAARFGQLDTTELPDTDDLAHPGHMLLDAQVRTAEAFGSARSHLLVNGSTVGILAMVHCVVGPGDVLLVGRDCHRSVLNAIRLAGAEPVFVATPAVSDGGLPRGPSSEDFLEVAARHPQARAVLLTRPNYYGVAVDLDGLSQALHRNGMHLLVDEAHGAHFSADPRFPATALASGADLVVQSLHKTLPSPSQTAVLHEGHAWTGVRAGLPVSSVAEAIALFQTSSPSWPLLAFADAAVSWYAAHGAAAYAALLDRIAAFSDRLHAGKEGRRNRFHLVGPEALPAVCGKDPTRLVLSAPGCGVALERFLRTTAGIVVEMADLDHVVLITTPFHDMADFDALADALDAAGEVMAPEGETVPCRGAGAAADSDAFPDALPDALSDAFPGSKPDALPQSVLPMDVAACRAREPVPLPEAAGRIAAVAVVPYPPGVAAIVAGERYDGALVTRLCRMAEAGVTLNGLVDGKCLCVRETVEA